jgi:hypothetical protein
VLCFAEKEVFVALLRFWIRCAVFWLTNRAPLEALHDAHDGTRLARS